MEGEQMGQISLAEAVKLKSILNRRIHELDSELRRVAFTMIEKGEEPKEGLRTLDMVEADLDDVRLDSRKLDKLIYEANINHTLTFGDEILTIVEAIELATQLRAKAVQYKNLATVEKEEIQYGYGDSIPVYRVALFDPEAYRLKALAAEKSAHKLSNQINAVNYTVHIPFDDSKYF